ncbi:MAG: FtsX-like permease family protein [Erysipelotrichaceae bacterium]|nr:FtsX-like permease family protein [Erysipelotrichaceae bacterium]
MNFFQRAIQNIKVKLSRFSLLAITYFVIGNFIIVGIGISYAANTAKELTRKTMTPVVTYGVDFQSYYEWIETLEDQDEIDKAYENYPRIKAEEVKGLLNDERVKTASAVNTDMIYLGEGVSSVPLGNEREQQERDYRDYDAICKGNIIGDMIEFHNGTYTMVDGRFYTQEEVDNNSAVAIISQGFADYNNLRIGDTFTLSAFNLDELKDRTYWNENGEQKGPYSDLTFEEGEEEIEYEVIGIYSHNIMLDPGSDRYQWMSAYENPDNTILIPGYSLMANSIDLVNKLREAEYNYYKQMNPEDEYYQGDYEPYTVEKLRDEMYLDTITVLLNDPLDVESYVNDFKAKTAETEYRRVDANNEDFKKYSKPLDSITFFANIIIWIVVAFGIIVITLIIALTLKTREYEIGVLLSLGTTKLKVVLQFFVELAIVAMIGFTIAVVSGSLVSKKVGSVVLDYAVASVDEESEYGEYYVDDYYDPWNNNYNTELDYNTFIEQYNVQINPIIIVTVYAVGLGITMISILIPSMMIMRFNPKRILMNQQ